MMPKRKSTCQRIWGRFRFKSTNKILKRELIYRRAFTSLDQLRRELNSYVRWCNEERIHSTLSYMSPVEFRKAGLSL